MHYKSLAIADPLELTFGLAPKPVTTKSGMLIGGGTVYPELNFTLPSMSIEAGTMPEVRRNYEQIIEGALRRAADLETPGVVIEFETLPPMTEHPQWGLDIAKVLLEGMEREKNRSGLKSVLRIAPNEVIWFDTLQDTLNELPESESEFIGQQLALADKTKFLPEEYVLKA